MQRLFSTFPEGWPGYGLVCLRVAAVMACLQQDIGGVFTAHWVIAAANLVESCASTLLLFGLWTPVAGVLMSLAELILALLHSRNPWIHILLGTVGLALAMIGPGAWSLDARCFGRKRLQIPHR